MARQRTAVQINSFVGGLNTETNPLTLPENTTIDESNVELTKKGTRKRRWGFDVEPSYVTRNTSLVFDDTKFLGRSQFLWENPGGDNDRHFLVIQVGNYLAFHDADLDTISSSLLFSFTFNVSTYSTNFTYAIISGDLVVATGLKTPSVFSFDGTTITKSDIILRVRDLWGVAAKDAVNVDLLDPLNITFRSGAGSITNTQLYSLRNQTFALPRVEGDADTTNLIDPIVEFQSKAGVWPSMADSVLLHLVADPNKTTNRTVERFNADSMVKTPPSNSLAPKGYFIIDALDRGPSRLSVESILRNRNPTLSLSVSSLPTDTTPGGPSIVASYAGRAWYSGFSGIVSGGDNQSPQLETTLFFSQQVQHRGHLPLCFQAGDPTSNTDPDVVDTDGGFIVIDGVSHITALIPLETSLFVLAENGVWRITGIDDESFSAVDFSVSKLGDQGCISRQSVVTIPSGIMFWGAEGIFLISMDETGSWVVRNISRDTIQTFYENVSAVDKKTSIGYYDSDDPSVRWIFGNGIGLDIGTTELIFNLRFQAFTKNKIESVPSIFGPLSVVGGSPRITPLNVKKLPKNHFYSVIVSLSPTITYTIGGYTKNQINDWVSQGGGIDSPAFLISNSITGGTARLKKNVPYVTVYLERTEAAQDEVLENPQNSSCFLQIQWDWTTDSLAGKWTTPKQVYRVLRMDLGQKMITTRNKTRGLGKSVAFKFFSEPGKTFHIYGWEFNLEATTDE